MRLARSIFGPPHMVIDVSYSGLALMTKFFDGSWTSGRTLLSMTFHFGLTVANGKCRERRKPHIGLFESSF
jgi:hypothetical protein